MKQNEWKWPIQEQQQLILDLLTLRAPVAVLEVFWIRHSSEWPMWTHLLPRPMWWLGVGTMWIYRIAVWVMHCFEEKKIVFCVIECLVCLQKEVANELVELGAEEPLIGPPPMLSITLRWINRYIDMSIYLETQNARNDSGSKTAESLFPQTEPKHIC